MTADPAVLNAMREYVDALPVEGDNLQLQTADGKSLLVKRGIALGATWLAIRAAGSTDPKRFGPVVPLMLEQVQSEMIEQAIAS